MDNFDQVFLINSDNQSLIKNKTRKNKIKKYEIDNIELNFTPNNDDKIKIIFSPRREE